MSTTIQASDFFKTKSRPIPVEAVQFNGKNGKKIVDWINSHAAKDIAKAKGSYILLGDVDLKILKGMIITLYPDYSFNVADLDEFKQNVVVPKNVEFI